MPTPRSTGTKKAGKSRKAAPKAHRSQNWTAEEWTRSQITGAEYNPRQIDADAARRLRENLRTVGLLSPIVVNRQTGRVVSGHQRLGALDALTKDKDYALTVAVVDLDEKTEREQNVFFNNPAAQGDWDQEMLQQLLLDDVAVDIEAMGLGVVDLEQFFDEDVVEQVLGRQSLFADNDITADVAQQSQEAYEAGKQAVKDRKAAMAEENKRDLPDFYTVVVFVNEQQQRDFMAAIEEDPDAAYADGPALLARIRNAKAAGEATG